MESERPTPTLTLLDAYSGVADALQSQLEDVWHQPTGAALLWPFSSGSEGLGEFGFAPFRTGSGAEKEREREREREGSGGQQRPPISHRQESFSGNVAFSSFSSFGSSSPSSSQLPQAPAEASPAPAPPRTTTPPSPYARALTLVTYVSSRVFAPEPDNRPILPIAYREMYRAMGLLHMAGNLRGIVYGAGVAGGQGAGGIRGEGGQGGQGGMGRAAPKPPKPRRPRLMRGAKHDGEGTGEQFRALEIALRERRGFPSPPSASSALSSPSAGAPLGGEGGEVVDYSARDFVVAVCVVGVLMDDSGTAASGAMQDAIARVLLGHPRATAEALRARLIGDDANSFSLLDAVHICGDALVEVLLRGGGGGDGGVLPLVLMKPEHVEMILGIVLKRWKGVVPALCVRVPVPNPAPTPSPSSLLPPDQHPSSSLSPSSPSPGRPRASFEYQLARGVDQNVVKTTHQTASTILLTLARIFHTDHPTAIVFHHSASYTATAPNASRASSTTSASTIHGVLDEGEDTVMSPGDGVPQSQFQFPDRSAPGSVQIRASLSLVLIFYYAALALSPSPSTYNNLGVLIASLGLPIEHGPSEGDEGMGMREGGGGEGGREFTMARAYYRKGLVLDGDHPHLLTNLGSLLKDFGDVGEANR